MAEAAPAQLDEQKIARAVSIGLPVVTIVGAGIVGVLVGPATSILVIAAGMLLGVIAILWGSIRILSGDAELPPELAELDGHSHADALASRKKMLLRALKDLENERAIGKLETDDFEQIAAQYRTALRAVMTKMDEALAPNRALAEEAAREHLLKSGVAGYRDPDAPARKKKAADKEKAKAEVPQHGGRDAPQTPPSDRVDCPKCEAKNEPDAKFCKECATKLTSTSEKTDA